MKSLYLAIGLCLAGAAHASTLEYTYNFGQNTTEWYGNAKTETYDVAVALKNPAFVGAKVTGLRVAVPASGISATSGWLTSELKLKKKGGKNVNNPDIATADATAADGWLTVTFAEPYTVTEAGVYVGYSLTVDEASGAAGSPVAVAQGVNADGLYLHSSKTKLRWGSMSEDLGKVSAMTVMLEGEFPAAGALLIPDGDVKMGVDEPTTVAATLLNCGTSAIESVEYAYTAGPYSGTGTARITSPTGAFIGERGTARIEFQPIDQTGTYDLALRVTKVNGQSVEGTVTPGTLKVYPFVPLSLPLVEEYTGVWCGYCPRGYVALETMKEREGDRFIAAAYHDSDAMQFDGNTPNSPDGLPAGYINRSSLNLAQIYTKWAEYCFPFPDGDVRVTAEWADADHTAIKATATTRFLEDNPSAHYSLSYILIADGLSNEAWVQNNSYSGATDKKGDMPGEWGDFFINGPSGIPGLVYNDVAVKASSENDFYQSVPAEIVAGQEYTHTYTFDISDLNAETYNQPDKMRVIAVLLRAGSVINSNSSDHMDGTRFAETVGIVAPEADATRAVEVARYNLQGQRLSAPAPGINIVRYSDGTARKIFVK